MRCLMPGRVTLPNKGIPHLPQFQFHGCRRPPRVAAPSSCHSQGCSVYPLRLSLIFAQFLLNVRSSASVKALSSFCTIPSLISPSALLFCDRTFQHAWNSDRSELQSRKRKVGTTPLCGAMWERAELWGVQLSKDRVVSSRETVIWQWNHRILLQMSQDSLRKYHKFAKCLRPLAFVGSLN